jgi:hypothetical protein
MAIWLVDGESIGRACLRTRNTFSYSSLKKQGKCWRRTRRRLPCRLALRNGLITAPHRFCLHVHRAMWIWKRAESLLWKISPVKTCWERDDKVWLGSELWYGDPGEYLHIELAICRTNARTRASLWIETWQQRIEFKNQQLTLSWQTYT